MPPGAPTAGQVGRALSWLGLGQVLGQLWWYGSLLTLGALLPPRDFGTIAAGMVIVNTAQLFMDSGTRGSLIVTRNVTRQLLQRAFAFNMITGVALTGAIALLAGPIIDAFAPGGDADALRFLALSVALSAFAPVPMALLQKGLYFKRHAAVMGGAATIASIIAIGAGLLGAGVWALALRQVLFQVVIAGAVWWNVRDLLPGRPDPSERGQRVRQEGAFWFFLVSLSQFFLLNVDYLVVGGVTNAEQLGLYSLAFTIAFAPMTQFSSQIGKVVFPATAATPDLGLVGVRVLKATRLLALVSAPLVPPAIALAPLVLPGVLGAEWTSMVVPFQLLLIAGTAHALLAVLQESLSGTGQVAFFARTSLIFVGIIFLALVVLTRLDGIRGAAIAHLVVLAPLAAAYGIWGSRRLGLQPVRVAGAVQGILLATVVEGAVTAATIIGLGQLGAAPGLAHPAAALAGLLVATVVLWRQRPSPLLEARDTFGAVLRRSPA
jgi:O-antigen/teichoic acid export membrane protein